MSSATATFSELLRTPNDVLEKLEQTGEVVIARRGAPSLRLTYASSAAAESETVGALAQLIAASLDVAARDRMAGQLLESFPWIDFLPLHARREFVGDFLRSARACASIGRFDRLAVLLSAWKGTAEAYADPSVAIDGSDLDYLPSAEQADDPRLRD